MSCHTVVTSDLRTPGRGAELTGCFCVTSGQSSSQESIQVLPYLS
jgi:hypothetical protein